MTRKEEKIVFEMLNQIKVETHQNNLMLQDICEVINTYLANHNKENEDDFGRNVLANLISSGIDVRSIFKRRQ